LDVMQSMFIPAQIMGYLDTEILDNIYMLQLVAIQHILLCWVTLPGYAYYFTFVWVELHHPYFPQAANVFLKCFAVLFTFHC